MEEERKLKMEDFEMEKSKKKEEERSLILEMRI